MLINGTVASTDDHNMSYNAHHIHDGDGVLKGTSGHFHQICLAIVFVILKNFMATSYQA